MSLKVEQLTKVYKSQRGINQIEFEVENGEVYGLIGPNGAGKTTILKVLSTLLTPDQGEVSIDGINLKNDPESYKKQLVGLIGDTVLYEYLTPMEHLGLMRIHYGDITEAEMLAVLGDMDLEQYKDEKVRQFSTGMKQRLAFAMCIVKTPKVLLLDEPFSGLDIEGKILIRNKVCALRDAGDMAIIISSHLIHDLEEVATKVGIVKEGRLIDEQDVGGIRRHYKNLEAYFVEKTIKLKEGA